MILGERHLRFSSPVLCARPGGVFFAYGLDVEGDAGAGLAQLRATDANGHPSPFTVLVDLHELSSLRRICLAPDGIGTLPVGGGPSVTDCDEDGRLTLRTQSTLELERDSLGVLVLAPGPAIPWSLGVPAGQVREFLAAVEACATGPALAVVA